jgi:hypothetical protein
MIRADPNLILEETAMRRQQTVYWEKRWAERRDIPNVSLPWRRKASSWRGMAFSRTGAYGSLGKEKPKDLRNGNDRGRGSQVAEEIGES